MTFLWPNAGLWVEEFAFKEVCQKVGFQRSKSNLKLSVKITRVLTLHFLFTGHFTVESIEIVGFSHIFMKKDVNNTISEIKRSSIVCSAHNPNLLKIHGKNPKRILILMRKTTPVLYIWSTFFFHCRFLMEQNVNPLRSEIKSRIVIRYIYKKKHHI